MSVWTLLVIIVAGLAAAGFFLLSRKTYKQN